MSGDNSIIKNLDMLNLANINLKKAENEVKDHLMSVKIMELKKFSFVPYSNMLQKFSFRFNRGDGRQSVDDIEFNNPFGRITADHTKASFIYNKYVYIFEQKTASGEVRLNSELKGVQQDGMKFEKYKADRTKEGAITEIKLLTESNGYPIHYFFLLSGFRLNDERIKVICKQIKQTNGKAGMSNDKKGLPRVAGLNYKEFSNYSPFNHILYRDKSPDPQYYPMRLSEDADKKKYYVYLTDAVQLSFRINNNFLKAVETYQAWQLKEGDERFNKLKTMSLYIDQMLADKKGKARRHLEGYKDEKKIRVPLNLAPLDLGIGFSARKFAELHIDGGKQKQRILNPDLLFDTSKWMPYSHWKKQFDEVSTFYYQTAFAWGAALLRVYMSDEYMYQVADYTYGSHEGSAGNEFSLDEIEDGKADKDGFDKEEGLAIYSNIVSHNTGALSRFEGTAGFVRAPFKAAFSLLWYINNIDFDMEKFFANPDNMISDNMNLAVFMGKKWTAGLGEMVDVMVSLNMSTVQKTLIDIEQSRIQLDDLLGSIRLAEKRYSKELSLLERYKKSAKGREEVLKIIKTERDSALQFAKATNKRLKTTKGDWKKAVILGYKQDIKNYLKKHTRQKLTLKDLVLNENGELVDIKNIAKSKRGHKFNLIGEVRENIESKRPHKSIEKATEELKKEFKRNPSVTKKAKEEFREYEKDYDELKRKLDGADSKTKMSQMELKKKNTDFIEKKRSLNNGLDKQSSIELNIKKLEKISEGFTFLNFVFESINMGFAIYDTIVKIRTDKFTINDGIGAAGSFLDWSDSMIEFSTLVIKYSPFRTLLTMKPTARLLRIGSFMSKLSAGIGVVSGAIDCYMDLSEIPGNFMEGDTWGVAGNYVAGVGGYMTALSSLLVLLGASGGTAAPAVVILLVGGIVYQISGYAIKHFLASDEQELWLRHTCWGDEFGRKETTALFFTVPKPDWAVVDFDYWAYIENVDSEYKEKLGWAGRLDAQLDSFNLMICNFGFSVSGCRDYYLRAESTVFNSSTGRYEENLVNRLKGGYFEVLLTIPARIHMVSTFIISIWLESRSGGKVATILDKKRALIKTKQQIKEFINSYKSTDPTLYDHLEACYTGSDYIYGSLERINNKNCLTLRVIDSRIEEQDDLPEAGVGSSLSSYDTIVEDFFELKGKELVKLDGLRDRLADNGSGIKLCISVQLDLFDNGKVLIPQGNAESFEKVIKISLAELNMKRKAGLHYRRSEPLSYYYDVSNREQYRGSIDKS